jgi:predicted nucleic acid-binding protein
MPWRCEDESTPASERMLQWAMDGSELHVPALWIWEILNVVGVTVRRRRITADRGREFLTLLATLNFKIDRAPQVTDFPRLHALAGSHGLTAYDVAYLELAKRLSLPLATCDRDLEEAALAEGVAVL